MTDHPARRLKNILDRAAGIPEQSQAVAGWIQVFQPSGGDGLFPGIAQIEALEAQVARRVSEDAPQLRERYARQISPVIQNFAQIGVRTIGQFMQSYGGVDGHGSTLLELVEASTPWTPEISIACEATEGGRLLDEFGEAVSASEISPELRAAFGRLVGAMRRYLADPDLWGPETFNDALNAAVGAALRTGDRSLFSSAITLYNKVVTRPEATWIGSAVAGVLAAKAGS